jgi:cobalamin biosynthesis protein CbiD
MHFALIETIEQQHASVSQIILEILMLPADLNVWSIQTVHPIELAKTTNAMIRVLVHVVLMPFVV